MYPASIVKIIGIAGGSGSGKSSLAIELQRLLSENCNTVEIFHLDKYFIRDIDVAPVIESELLGGKWINFNVPAIVNAQLAIDSILQSDAQMKIMEGHLLFAVPDLLRILDYKIFLDVPGEIRLARRILRDLDGKRLSSDPKVIINYYLLSAMPGYARWIAPSMKYAQLILDGTRDLKEIANQAHQSIVTALLNPI